MSTIGIKQHFNCDYLFHPNRTDFSGESGSGKSMVADMIQLILVGSRVYKSSTDSNRVRDPKGMVLEPKGRQYGIGYVFLNIETHYNKYIVLGAYIESSHNKVQAFIIQGGYDWEEQLTPLSKPIYYRNLLINDRILPVGALEEQLSEVRLKQLSWKAYHHLLYSNELLALDLTKDKTLESFAGILRSFSRGKGFKTDSAALKKFLFGDDDQNKLMQKYQEEVQAINNDFIEHQRYIAEIKLINEKQKHIEDIIQLHAEYEAKKLVYFTAKVWYWKGLNSRYTCDLEAVTTEFNISKCRQNVLTRKEASLEVASLINLKQLKQQLESLEEADIHSTSREDAAVANFNKARHDKTAIEKVELWLSKNDNSIDSVRGWYKAERDKVNQKDTLVRFMRYLEVRGQQCAFEASAWCTDLEVKRSRYPRELQQIEEKLKTLKALSVFSNLNDPDSLAVWAKDNLVFPVSHEVESVLVYFQEFPRQEPLPTQNDRYLPFPDKLFHNLHIAHQAENGFWINLDGVYEFIKYTESRLLDTSDVENLFAQLLKLHLGLEERVRELLDQQEAETNLKSALDGFGGLEEAVQLYHDRVALLDYSPDDVTFFSGDEFNRHLELYEHRNRIRREYEIAKNEHDQLTAGKSGREAQIKGIRNEIKQVQNHFSIQALGEADIDLLIQQREATLEAAETELGTLMDGTTIQEVESALIPAEASLTKVLQLKATHAEQHANISQRKSALEELLAHAEALLKESQQAYWVAFKAELDFTSHQAVSQNPDEGEPSLEDLYKQSKETFHANYDLVKKSLEDANQLNNYSVGELAYKLLPTIFENSKVDKSIIEEKIAERLNKLTRDIQEIGSRKVEILKRVFTEVHKTYSQYLEKIQGIDTYLKRKNHLITGGNRASLRHRKSVDYPDKWMAPFRKQLDEALMNFGLFEDLKQEVDINKMMLRAFQAAGGNGKVSPEDLLNPKSYFDLDFDLKLDSGASNAGSQGQTYTANALLGLARLSLIEKEKRKGLRVMPIDEAEGLGGNYDMLHKLAKQEHYQIISMSIETAGDILEGEQYIYIMNENNLADESSYVPPLGIFSNDDPVEDIDLFIHQNNIEG
ncbi:hypothetical protein I2I11_08045 [Pontibacter sp. 172403-2]|uniref:hypothetical protein n=1 Tax=Pontibacter rufus TaxID=2791028 RepID=UPI0018B002D1|nr:hypothetical protein [Pontibacter sp. 172403-2]MBF9253239.1 hypothetical protein [Pontibacter sp. 172403-2]